MADRFDDSGDRDGYGGADVFFDHLDGPATRAGRLTGTESRHAVTAGDPRFAALAGRFRDGAAERALAAATFGEAGQPTGGPRHWQDRRGGDLRPVHSEPLMGCLTAAPGLCTLPPMTTCMIPNALLLLIDPAL